MSTTRKFFCVSSALLLIIGLGLSLVIFIPLSGRPSPRKEIDQVSRYEQDEQEFTATNPATLEGWSTRQREYFKGLTWYQDNLAYSDQNGDGVPDLKHRLTYLSTREVFWEDTDYDGLFDTIREDDCFDQTKRGLIPLVRVPRVKDSQLGNQSNE